MPSTFRDAILNFVKDKDPKEEMPDDQLSLAVAVEGEKVGDKMGKAVVTGTTELLEDRWVRYEGNVVFGADSIKWLNSRREALGADRARGRGHPDQAHPQGRRDLVLRHHLPRPGARARRWAGTRRPLPPQRAREGGLVISREIKVYGSLLVLLLAVAFWSWKAEQSPKTPAKAASVPMLDIGKDDLASISFNQTKEKRTAKVTVEEKARRASPGSTSMRRRPSWRAPPRSRWSAETALSGWRRGGEARRALHPVSGAAAPGKSRPRAAETVRSRGIHYKRSSTWRRARDAPIP